MEKDLREINSHALVGVLYGETLIYNVLDFDTCFPLTGLSIIQYLKINKNKFISDIILSQSYNGIKYIMDDSMLYNEFYNNNEQNVYNFNRVADMLLKEFQIIYIYDVNSDMLLLKDSEQFIALDYTNAKDVRNYLNNVVL
jgi:hypothetical protein